MNYFKLMREVIHAELKILADAGALPAGLDLSGVTVELPRSPDHGDLATNAGLVLAGPARKPPRQIATVLAARLVQRDDVAAAEAAGPGFVNLRFHARFWHARLAQALRAGADYGRSRRGAAAGAVNVEYVSANPTGPMHVGHARGAVFGDALASVLEFAGYDVTREYFVNDAGAQVDALARSAYLRYREALGHNLGAVPEGLYPGDYLRPVGAALAETHGASLASVPEAEWMPVVRDAAVSAMIAEIHADLEALGVRQEVFTSERALIAAGRVDVALRRLSARGLVYRGTLRPPKGMEPEGWEPRDQDLFRSTEFGDDTDRPLRKSGGEWTYFATDLAYHADKISRGFRVLVDVWGADHAGYVNRMRAAVRALSDGAVELDVKLCQLVTLLRGGTVVKMSKRAGDFVTLREVVDEVGRDVVRFIMLTRRNDAPLEFDFSAVTEESRENPVFYVQYAHARCCSVLRIAREERPGLDTAPAALATADLGRLTHAAELALIRVLAGWPRAVEVAAETHEPHRIAFYVRELAACLHTLWTRGKEDDSLRFLVPEDDALTAARLALVRGCALGIATGLRLLGVTPVEELR